MNDGITSSNGAATSAAVTTRRVIFGDTDAGGVVYHPRYLEMAEHNRNELMRVAGLELGTTFERRRLAFALRSVDMKFHGPAQFDDRLALRTVVERIGAASSTWVTRIRRGGTLVCTVRAELVCMDRTQGRPIVYPDDVRSVFKRARTGVVQPAPQRQGR